MQHPTLIAIFCMSSSMSCCWPTEGVHYWLGRSWGGELVQGTCFPTPRVPGGFALFAQPSRDLARDSSNIATAYAEMHVKIAGCNHQIMSVDTNSTCMCASYYCTATATRGLISKHRHERRQTERQTDRQTDASAQHSLQSGCSMFDLRGKCAHRYLRESLVWHVVWTAARWRVSEWHR